MVNRLKEARIVNLANIQNLVDNALVKEIAPKCKKMKKLVLKYCTHVTDEAIAAIAENCPHLTSVDISTCSVTNLSIKILAEKCKNLEFLAFNYCFRITPDVMDFLKQLPNLKNVEVHQTYRFISWHYKLVTTKFPHPLVIHGGIEDRHTHDREKLFAELKTKNFIIEKMGNCPVSKMEWEYKKSKVIGASKCNFALAYNLKESKKLYVIIGLDTGCFGFKLKQGRDYEGSRDLFRKKINISKDPISLFPWWDDVKNWGWMELYQNDRTVCMAGFDRFRWMYESYRICSHQIKQDIKTTRMKII
eukprot:UN24477